jgi:TetR/AcrR family transcriptional regulator, cholesterol catabolism regulator
MTVTPGNEATAAHTTRREEIVTKAAELFDEKGYGATSVDDIAAAIGIKKPTLYYYFRSKHEILREIHEQFISHLLRQQERRKDSALTPEQALLEVMIDIFEVVECWPGHVRVFIEHARELDPADMDQIQAKRDQFEHAVRDIFRRGQEEGAFRKIDAGLAALALLGMCNWAYQWYRPGGLTTRELAHEFYSFFVRGVGAPGRAGRAN